jgi:hypothetical protein
MESRKIQLLRRLDDIGASLARTGHGLALIGLGSVGTELDRIDDYSDLDFFAIVQDGHKQAFIDNLDWLAAVHPIVFAFLNTHDGYKLLYADGIFCEMAVFEAYEMAHVPFAHGRIVWKDESFDESLAAPQLKIPRPKSVEWLLGEALTNLYVGLGRYHRGEKLSAARFIQGYAVDRLVELTEQVETPQPAHKDIFTPERRFEARFPGLTAHLPHFMQGYERSVESARAILEYLDQHFEVNPALKTAILELTV